MSRGVHPNIRFRATRGFHPISDDVHAPTSAKASMSRTWIRDGFKLAPCHGEAHSNPMIDNCSRCAPLWEWVVIPETPKLDPEQVDALAKFREEHGERWKLDLSLAWHRGSASPELHRLRNTHGSTWLDYVELDAEIERVADELTRVVADVIDIVRDSTCAACKSIAALERDGVIERGDAVCKRHPQTFTVSREPYRGGVL